MISALIILLIVCGTAALLMYHHHRRRAAGQALLTATETGDLAQMRRLLAQGANLNTRTPQGWTSLHVAAIGGDPTVVELLLQHGADVHALSNTGNTPLYQATAFGGRKVVIDLLLAYGARPDTAWDPTFGEPEG
jgi:ankyrin repeat protein